MFVVYRASSTFFGVGAYYDFRIIDAKNVTWHKHAKHQKYI